MLAAGDGKTLRAVNAVAIEQGHRRHLQFGRSLGEMFRRRSAAQKTEGTARVEFDVGHTQCASVIPSEVEGSRERI